MLGRLRSLFQTKQKFADPYEQFVVAFVEECRRQGLKPSSYDHQRRLFFFEDIGGGEVTVYLENCFRHWQGQDEQTRVDILNRFVRSAFEATTSSGAAPPLAELMPGVRSHALISNVLIQNREPPGPTGNEAEIAWAPLCGDLVSIVNHDRPDTLTPLARGVLAGADLSFDEAMKHAMANLRARISAPSFERYSTLEGMFVCENLTDFQSSLLLLTPGADFHFPALRGDPIALVPSRNQFFVTGSQDPAGLEFLMDLADAARQHPHFLSSSLVAWRDGRWTNFKLEAGSEQAAKQRLIEIRDLGLDYEDQKNLLDRLHAEQNNDVFVSNFMAVHPRPGSEFSITFLSSGSTDTLLPKADRIRFLRQAVDAKTGIALAQEADVVEATWADAMEIAGSMFEPVAGLYPERYRVRRFPEAEMWSRLKEMALS